MKVVLAILSGLLVLAAASIAFAPASLVDVRLASISRGTLRAADLQGTLWHGRGTLTTPDGRWRLPFEWTLQPLPLLRGRTSIVFGATGDASQGVRGRAEFTAGRVDVEALALRVPAMVVASISGPATLQAGGDIDLQIEAMTLTPIGGSGAVVVQWRNARVAAEGLPVVDLGTLTARLAVRGKALAGPITSAGGAVLSSGNLSIDADNFAANVRLVPALNASPQLRQALASLGRADPSGAVSVRVERSTR